MTDDWIDIKDKPVPKDGSWFVIYIPDSMPELGRYNPTMHDVYYNVQEETGSYDLYRRVQERGYEWEGFNNMLAATHWMPLKPPEGADG